jgi:aspartate racemase
MNERSSGFLAAANLEQLEALLLAERGAVDSGLQRAGGRPVLPPIVPVSRHGELPLSFAQQRLWFLDQLEPGSPLYNIPTPIRLTGELNVKALEQSLNEIIRANESLRTTFPVIDGEPIQVIAPSLLVRISEVSLLNLPGGEREVEAQRLVNIECLRTFDIAEGPLILATLVKIEEQVHILILNMHHIICDGWSMGVLFRELAALYADYSLGRPPPQSDYASLQYADFAHWQRQWLQGDVLEEQLAYWREQLAAAPLLLELPTDRPRPSVKTFNGEVQIAYLPRGLSEAVKALGRREGVTLFMTLLAAFQTLLYRYTGKEDICVGTPIANRNRAELENLMGFFVNTLVMRSDLSGDPTFPELLQRVREVALGGYAHQDVPFEKLVEELQPVRSLSHSPLFQVLFALQNASMQTVNPPKLELSLMEVNTHTAKFDLTMGVKDTEQGLRLRMEYNTDLFDAPTVTRLVSHFQNLLSAVVSNAARPLHQLPLLSASERARLLVEWNDTRRPFPSEKCLQDLFDEQAVNNPSAVALECDDETVTYGELQRRSNQLAHYLRGFGVGPEVPVAVLMERSIEVVVSLLGILKAGGAYVPLDPSYPRERLGWMLDDSGARLVLAQQRFRGSLPEDTVSVVILEEALEVIERHAAGKLESGAKSDNLAYIIYTSGSTGRPKGTAVTHQSIVRLVKSTDYVHFGADEVFLLLSNLSFDASTFELWGSLLHGARLAILSVNTPSLVEVGKALLKHKVTTLWLTAGLFHQMVEEQLDDLKGVRQLLAGGDVLSVSHVKTVLQHFKGCRLTNGYGPTEVTTFACCYSMNSVDDVGASVSIGRPIANTEVYILDEELEPVPVGIYGELYIGGAGMARGYLNRAELTAEKFIPHPFSADGGARLYRTGDLVRYLVDGEIEFVGRRDQQVKIRGFRIELGEIEAALGQHEAVRQAVVLARANERGEKRLVAYIVAAEEISGSELRLYLKERLPEYMLPAVFVTVAELPLTPNGKVDRGALPAPEGLADDQSGAYEAPQTAIEEVLAGIWAEVLGVERVSRRGNFFDIGGHSLLATRVISWVRKVFKVELPLRTLFEEPTVAGLAGALETEAGEVAGLQRTAELLLGLVRQEAGVEMSVG